MTATSWGYSGQVGEWYGELDIPQAYRFPPDGAARWALDVLIPIFSDLHRPRKLLVSWAEYDDQGTELAFKELVKFEASSWAETLGRLTQLSAAAHGIFALSALFVAMDVSVMGEDNVLSWVESAAELQISVSDTEFRPVSTVVSYRTYIDVWLPRTYDEQRVARSNEAAAARNGPRLATLLRAFRAQLGDSFRIGESTFYYDAITATGFRDLEKPSEN
jgi:hypothetical protein